MSGMSINLNCTWVANKGLAGFHGTGGSGSGFGAGCLAAGTVTEMLDYLSVLWLDDWPLINIDCLCGIYCAVVSLGFRLPSCLRTRTRYSRPIGRNSHRLEVWTLILHREECLLGRRDWCVNRYRVLPSNADWHF